MSRLVEFTTEDGAVVLVETADDEDGTQLVSRGGDGAAERAARTFEATLGSVRSAADSALRVFRAGTAGAPRPDSVELEFGVKLSAEAGAIITSAGAEAQLVVRLSWRPKEA